MRRLAIMLAMLLAAGGAAAEKSASDLLFATPHLAQVAPGEQVRYSHRRVSDPALNIGPDIDEAIALRVAEGQGGREVTVTLDADGSPRDLDPFRSVPGNPLLMVFLEDTVRAVNRATGGSPFYLRNRMRDALRDQLTEAPSGDGGTVLTMQPFGHDANRAKLGAFADMRVRFEVAPDAPGMLVAMSAEAGTAYSEEIRLVPSR